MTILSLNNESTVLICRQYFRKACDVEKPEIHFNIDQYTDATLVVKPQIYISIDDIINTHSKLLEYKSKIAADTTDAIHELLDDLGEKAPTVAELLGGNLYVLSFCLLLAEPLH